MQWIGRIETVQPEDEPPEKAVGVTYPWEYGLYAYGSKYPRAQHVALL